MTRSAIRGSALAARSERDLTFPTNSITSARGALGEAVINGQREGGRHERAVPRPRGDRVERVQQPLVFVESPGQLGMESSFLLILPALGIAAIGSTIHDCGRLAMLTRRFRTESGPSYCWLGLTDDRRGTVLYQPPQGPPATGKNSVKPPIQESLMSALCASTRLPHISKYPTVQPMIAKIGSVPNLVK
jgi:hypothetical protein